MIARKIVPFTWPKNLDILCLGPVFEKDKVQHSLRVLKSKDQATAEGAKIYRADNKQNS